MRECEETITFGDIDLTIERGEVVAVSGPSGSGKSTLIRCINRLETTDSGNVVVDGVHVEDPEVDIRRVRGEVGMVFQGFHLYPHLSVLENTTLAPMSVGIPEKAAASPAQLSGGQQQRVAIARALAMESQGSPRPGSRWSMTPALTAQFVTLLKDTSPTAVIKPRAAAARADR